MRDDGIYKVRVPSDVMAQIEELAANETRSVCNTMLVLIKRGLECETEITKEN